MTLEQSPQSALPQMELPLMQSAEASHAKTLASQEKAQALKANVVDYGLNTPELLASFDHDTSSWRTSQHCLVEGLTEFSERWPRSGMMQSGTAYQLQPLAPLTDATECGLWRTPQASDGQRGTYATQKSMDSHLAKGKQLSLPNQVKHIHLWPTPKANDAKKGVNFDMTNNRNGLPAAAKMYPTPCARDWKDTGTAPSELKRHSPPLAVLAGGALNPMWVEWLMGFPLGHTDLKL
jgi:hypothetical protein